MQTEVGLFIFHVSLPGGCLLLCQFPHLFCTIFFLGYTFGSLVKRAMHQPPPCTFCKMRLYIFFYPDALLTLITSIYCGEKYVPE